MSVTQEEMVWHKDGHSIHLQLNRSDVVISMIRCPGHDNRECKLGKFDCIVKHFLETYGLDCNVGICDCSSEIELAWSALGEFDEPEQCQVWVIPIDDEAFAAWLITQS